MITLHRTPDHPAPNPRPTIDCLESTMMENEGIDRPAPNPRRCQHTIWTPKKEGTRTPDPIQVYGNYKRVTQYGNGAENTGTISRHVKKG